MCNKPKVAVLMAAYNGMRWIEEQIESIFSQVDVDLFLYISVDLSSDETLTYCMELARHNVRVTVLPYGVRFGGAAKNFYRLIHDVDISRFDYVSLADQDDIWMSNKLIHAIELIRCKRIDAISSDTIAFDENGCESLVKKSYQQKRYDYLFEAAGPGCTYVFTTTSLKYFKVFLRENWNSFNEINLHDWMLYAFYRSRKLKWFIDPTPLMKYRQHQFNQIGFNSGLRAYKKRLQMIQSKWYRTQVEKITRVLGNSKLSRWQRIKNFTHLRRRPRDAFVLLVMNIFGIF
jgi:rhamnosyltransferase